MEDHHSVDASTGHCKVLEGMANVGVCGQGEKCYDEEDGTSCRPIDSKTEYLVWMWIGLAVGIPLLIIIICGVAVCYRMKCKKTKKMDDTSIKREELTAPFPDYQYLQAREVTEHPYQTILKHMEDHPQRFQMPRVNQHKGRGAYNSHSEYTPGLQNQGYARGDLSEGY